VEVSRSLQTILEVSRFLRVGSLVLPIHALCKTDVSWDGRDGCNAHALYEHSLGSTRWPMLEDLVLNANMYDLFS